MGPILADSGAVSWRDDIEIQSPRRDSRLVDDAVYAYEDWLEECVRVENAYARWSHAGSADAGAYFAAYLSSLDAEEEAADAFRDSAVRLRRAAISRTSSRSGSRRP